MRMPDAFLAQPFRGVSFLPGRDKHPEISQHQDGWDGRYSSTVNLPVSNYF